MATAVNALQPAPATSHAARSAISFASAVTKTASTASASGYDARPGADSAVVGCWENGFLPVLSRGGMRDDVESRWSCAHKIVTDGGLCEIEFTLNDPQDIIEVQIAFLEGWTTLSNSEDRSQS